MNDKAIRIFPLGDTALTVEFGNAISPELNRKAIALAESIERRPFPGLVETVPAYATTTVFYDLREVRRSLRYRFSLIADLNSTSAASPRNMASRLMRS